MLDRLKKSFINANMTWQFWLYELGNINAAVTGSGGYEAFSRNIGQAWGNDGSVPYKISALAAQYPDATTAIGIAGLVVVAPAARKILSRLGRHAVNVCDAGTVAGAGGLLAYSIMQDASLITSSAASFVTGSALLKHSPHNPFFLKPGGLALAAGGAFLGAFGVQNALSAADTVHMATGVVTALNGVYVTTASLMTYEGGIYETMAWAEKNPDDRKDENTWAAKLLHPVKGSLSQIFAHALDKPVQTLNAFAGKTLLRYIPDQIKQTRPFETSMWARIPARALLIGSSLWEGNWGLLTSTALWSGGDVAIGMEDLKKPKNSTAEPPPPA